MTNPWKDLVNRAMRTEVPEPAAALPTVPFAARTDRPTPAWLVERGVDFAGFPSGEVVTLRSRVAILSADLTAARTDLERVKAELKQAREDQEVLQQRLDGRLETLAGAELAHRQELDLDTAFKRRQYDGDVCP